ncbi:MAG: hypothetical protein KC766_28615, partial [Myxococcales bacterium]|nr:hypothetical protein [Myxococcales bacterium]
MRIQLQGEGDVAPERAGVKGPRTLASACGVRWPAPLHWMCGDVGASRCRMVLIDRACPVAGADDGASHGYTGFGLRVGGICRVYVGL